MAGYEYVEVWLEWYGATVGIVFDILFVDFPLGVCVGVVQNVQKF